MKHNTEFIGFTSAFGGSGCTSLAMAFARIASIFHKRKVLYLSFDYLGCKMAPGVKSTGGLRMAMLNPADEDGSDSLASFCDTDEIGVSYLTDNNFDNFLYLISPGSLDDFLTYISLCTDFDLVVLDVPFRSEIALQALIKCEKIILNLGYLQVQNEANGLLRGHLRDLFEGAEKCPEISDFKPSEDPDSFYLDTVDIHGEFGGEVRLLAEKLL